jgi:chromosome segregation protein
MEKSTAKNRKNALLKEIILENFMSYEYARIPLKPGLNTICGPNGSGKSSILLAISVALGQAYTERSRKLSDLIRWGKNMARVTLLFDNSPINGRRPIQSSSSDVFRVSRYLKRDGSYWYETDFKNVSKAEVMRIFANFGINPDNMLIIMHQNMIEELSVISPQQKLKAVEDAVGFQTYRQDILEAQNRLTRLTSEEESISSLLKNAEQTLNYWKGEYDKYLRRKELLQRKNFLECEMVWSQVIKQEKALEALCDEIERKTDRLNKMIERINETRNNIRKIREKLSNHTLEQRKTYYSLLQFEKEKASIETRKEVLHEIFPQLESYRKNLENLNGNIRGLKTETIDFPKNLMQIISKQLDELKSYLQSTLYRVQQINEKSAELDKKISNTQSKLGQLEESAASTQERYIAEKISEAVLGFRREMLENEISKINREKQEALTLLKELTLSAEKVGARIETKRNPAEILEEIKMTTAFLASLGEISEDTEKMYTNYLNIYDELKKKSEIVSENRKKALEEINLRKETWRNVLQNLINEVNPAYQEILSKVGATGKIRLTNMDDVELAGLELLVGFKGSTPTILDAYTQSGGERSTAIMAFLLALQQHVKSPIRAVDEFDIHMDPRNREIISRLIVSSVKEMEGIQYITITPGQLAIVDKDIHVITVQNVQGISEVKTVS